MKIFTTLTKKATVSFVMKNMNVKHLDDTEMRRQVELLQNLMEIQKKLEPVTCPHCGYLNTTENKKITNGKHCFLCNEKLYE